MHVTHSVHEPLRLISDGLCDNRFAMPSSRDGERAILSSKETSMQKEVKLSAGVVRYRDVGSGAPLLFVHGLLVSSALWRKVVPLLSRSRR